MKTSTHFSKQAKILIDGIEANTLIYGSLEVATVYAYFELNGIEYTFSAYGVSKKTMPQIDKYFSSIKIDGDIARKKATNTKPISSLVSMIEPQTAELDKITLAKPDLSEAFFVNLDVVKLKLYLEGKPEKYVFYTEKPLKSLPKDKIITLVPKEGEALSVFKMDKSVTSCSVRLATRTDDAEEMMKGMKNGWKAYKNIKALQASMLIDGVKWGNYSAPPYLVDI